MTPSVSITLLFILISLANSLYIDNSPEPEDDANVEFSISDSNPIWLSEWRSITEPVPTPSTTPEMISEPPQEPKIPRRNRRQVPPSTRPLPPRRRPIPVRRPYILPAGSGIRGGPTFAQTQHRDTLHLYD